MNGSTYIENLNLTVRSDDWQLLRDLKANAYGDLDTLIKSGVFSFRNGVAEIHRDDKGKLKSISVKQYTFKG